MKELTEYEQHSCQCSTMAKLDKIYSIFVSYIFQLMFRANYIVIKTVREN